MNSLLVLSEAKEKVALMHRTTQIDRSLVIDGAFRKVAVLSLVRNQALKT